MHEEGRGRWLGLAMLSLGVSMIIIDTTIVNVAVPSIIRDLRIDSTTAEWINTVYALVFAALLVTLGRVGDLLGRRAMYLTGLVVFVVASVLAGAAPSGELLIAARVLQGVGGAMILPSTQSILNTNFRGRDRAIAFGIWGAIIGGMAAVGPLIGGWLTTYLTWRWAFFINIPIAAIAFFGTLHYIKESKDEHAKAGFDPAGFLLITLGLGAFVFGLIEGRTYGWWAPTEPFTLFGWTWPFENISIIPVAHRVRAGGAGPVLRRRGPAIPRRQVLPVRRRAVAVQGVPLRQPGGHDRLARRVRPAVRPAPVPPGRRRLLGVRDRPRVPVAGHGRVRRGPDWPPVSRTAGARGVPVTLGMSLEAIGIVATTLLISVDVTGLQLMIPLFVYGIGVGFATAQLTSIVLSDIPAERSGLASGANSTVRQVGSALGIAILGTVLFVSLGNGVHRNLSTVPGLPPEAVDGIAQAMEASAGQALVVFKEDPKYDALVPGIEAAFVDATKLAGFVATGFVLFGVLFSLLLPKTQMHKAPDHEPVAVDAVAGEDPESGEGPEPEPIPA